MILVGTFEERHEREFHASPARQDVGGSRHAGRSYPSHLRRAEMGRKPSEDRGDLNLKNEYDNEKTRFINDVVAPVKDRFVLPAQTAGIEEKEVLRNEDVIFHQIDEHTWFGTGHLMANESLYLVEGETKAILIDAGTKIKDLDKLVASITDKPVTLVATHVHPDHTGSAIDYFPEIYINPADTIGIPEFMPNYKGKVCFLTDGEILDLGGRTLEVVLLPGILPDRPLLWIRMPLMVLAAIRSAPVIYCWELTSLR